MRPRRALPLLCLLACGEGPAPATGLGDDVVLRRLSVSELDNVLSDLVGVTSRPAATTLPADPRSPFDNDVGLLKPSSLWVASVERMANQVADEVTSDPDHLAALLGCPVPAASVDAARACLADFAPGFLRLAWRREVGDDDVAAVLALADEELTRSPDLVAAAKLVLRAVLQDPELHYRAEAASADDPTRVDDATIASRMSFTLWGSVPDPALLDAARDGTLRTVEGRQAQARRMMAHPRAIAQAKRLHAMWLSYDQLSDDRNIVPLINLQVDELVERVLFTEHRPWRDLLNFPELPLFETTAMMWGLPWVRGQRHQWLDVTSTGRAGILSTVAFMSGSSHTNDTSPTRRGKRILERLLCAPPPPPPTAVNADTPPATDLAPCKIDRYAQHLQDEGCRSCHATMDSLGIGLERYDKIGSYRLFDNKPFEQDVNLDCPLPEGADVPGLGSFRTLQDLADLLHASDAPSTCFVKYAVQHAYGGMPGTSVATLAAALTPDFLANGERYDELLVALVAQDDFIRRTP